MTETPETRTVEEQRVVDGVRVKVDVMRRGRHVDRLALLRGIQTKRCPKVVRLECGLVASDRRLDRTVLSPQRGDANHGRLGAVIPQRVANQVLQQLDHLRRVGRHHR